MTIYFGSSTDEDLIAELEQRGYFCAKAQEPLSYRDILRIYNEVGPEDGVPYRFAGAIEAITKEQK